jgi:hypothetical protein
MIID